MLIQLTEVIPGCVGVADNKDGSYRVDFANGSRSATKEEIQAALAAQQAEEFKQTESTTARDDAKRALTALDTIIGGIDAATLAQAKTAIKQLAQIQRHIIIALLGRP